MRVLQSFRAEATIENPYVTLLEQSLEPYCDVVRFSWGIALFGRYNVFHVHWPEAMVSAASPWRAHVYEACLVILLLRLWVTRRPIVRTVHNLAPHERMPGLAQALLRWIERRTTARIYLNASVPMDGGSNSILIPHGEYVSWYGRYPQFAPRAGLLACFGRIRPYKGVESLARAFTQLSDDALRLVVAGRPETEECAEYLRSTAKANDRIELILEMVPHNKLAEIVSASESIVLPYPFYNSGAVILALSLSRPVIGVSCPALDALAQECGPEWVFCVDAPLTATTLSRAISEVRAATRVASPTMVDRDWATQAPRLADLYRSLSRRHLS